MLDEDQTHTTENMVLPPLLDKQIEWINTHQYRHSSEYVEFLHQLEEHTKSTSDQQDESTIANKFEEFVTFIFSSVKDSLSLHSQELNDARLHITELKSQLEQAHDRVQGLQDEIHILKKKNGEWQEEYDNAKTEQAQMQQRYERMLKDLKHEKKQIRQTFREVQQSTEIERQLLQNLQIENEEMGGKWQEERKQKEQLLEELKLYKDQMSQSQKKLAQSHTKLTWESKRIEQLELDLEERDKVIQKLRDQLYPMEEIQLDEVVDPKLPEEKANAGRQRNSFMGGVKLSEEMIHLSDDASFLEHRDSIILNIPFKQDRAKMNQHSRPEPTHNTVEEEYVSPSIQHHSQDQEEEEETVPVTIQIESPTISRPRVEEDQPLPRKNSIEEREQVAKETTEKRKDDCPETHPTQQEQDLGRRALPVPLPLPDFYYAHYLLITQSVKMQLNQEQYYEKDMRPLYRELLKETVPMHQWAQWVQRRLQRG